MVDVCERCETIVAVFAPVEVVMVLSRRGISVAAGDSPVGLVIKNETGLIELTDDRRITVDKEDIYEPQTEVVIQL